MGMAHADALCAKWGLGHELRALRLLYLVGHALEIRLRRKWRRRLAAFLVLIKRRISVQVPRSKLSGCGEWNVMLLLPV